MGADFSRKNSAPKPKSGSLRVSCKDVAAASMKMRFETMPEVLLRASMGAATNRIVANSYSCFCSGKRGW
jgi:hypothetical protein